MSQTTDAPEVLTLDEVAAYLRLPEEAIVRQAAQGYLPGRQIEDTWRFHKAAIDDWLHSAARKRLEVAEESGMEKNLEDFKKAVSGYKEEVIGNHESNQRWDIWLTAIAIVFTLLATVVGTLDEGTLIPGDFQKVLIGIFGAISVAAQSATTKFPVHERSKGYRKLRNQLHALALHLAVSEQESADGLKKQLTRYEEILKAEEEIP
jgi:excisionase family DNA binding protein